jgi:hypothetical protein
MFKTFLDKNAIVLTVCTWAALSIFGTTLTGAARDTNTLPPNISSNTAFKDIGKALSGEPDFPHRGTDSEKASYLMKRIPDIVSKYGLRAGADFPRSFYTGPIVALGRLHDPVDAEDVAALKKFGWGNCAEFSEAFQEMMKGAGMPNSTVVYADNKGGEGYSPGFGGTDTAVMLEEPGPNGKLVRRIFDPFRAIFHSSELINPPTLEESIKQWSDLPMSPSDVRNGDKERGLKPWQTRLGKDFVKAQGSEFALPPPANNPKAWTADERSKARLAAIIPGLWASKNGCQILIQGTDGSYTAQNVKRSARQRVMGVPENSTYFTGGKITKWEPLTMESKGCWTFVQQGDCPHLAPFTRGEVTFTFQLTNIANSRSRVPQYYSSKCIWAVNQPWSVDTSVWTKIK